MVDLTVGTRVKCVFNLPPSRAGHQFHLPEITIIEVKPETNALVIQMQVSAELLGEGVWNAMVEEHGGKVANS